MFLLGKGESSECIFYSYNRLKFIPLIMKPCSWNSLWKPGLVVHVCNPSWAIIAFNPWEAESIGNSRSAWFNRLSQTNTNTKGKNLKETLNHCIQFFLYLVYYFEGNQSIVMAYLVHLTYISKESWGSGHFWTLLSFQRSWFHSTLLNSEAQRRWPVVAFPQPWVPSRVSFSGAICSRWGC